MEREYYAERKGFIKKDVLLNHQTLLKAFFHIYSKFVKDGYFQKYFGVDCTDGFIGGQLGMDIEMELFLKTGLNNLYPIYQNYLSYNEIQLFTIIEFLVHHSSKPTDTSYHSWNDCGIHVTASDDKLGREDFRSAMNSILKRHRKVELSEDGQILEDLEEGFEPMFNAPIPTKDEIIKTKVSLAILKFRTAVSTLGQRKDAIRELADVLEFLKEQIRSVGMNKDTTDLFNIANNFGIRHFNPKQKTEYDNGIWHSWMFYCYLATIHACLRFIEKQNLDSFK